MAAAFYSTGDGHVGNLGKKTLSELKDLLARQQKLLLKKNFLNSLPDKGFKIIQFVETLERTINSREKSQKMCTKTDSAMKTEASMIIKDGHKGASRFKKERDKAKLKEEIGKNNDTEAEKIPITDSVSDQTAFTGDVLEHSFQTLTVADEADEEGNITGNKPVHQYQLAEERARHNAEVLKEPLKLNSFLRVSTVQELPPKFVPPKPIHHHNGTKMETDSISEHSPTAVHHRVIEDTAATPPTYKYEKTKQISLEESLSLQNSQKVRQDELQAELAVERLAERLHIKLEPYNPEGVDMSYRVSHGSGQANIIDSDDDDDNGVQILSDSDDS